MDNFAYLNQISKSARAKSAPAKKPSLFKVPISKFIIIGLVIFFLLMALGGLLGSIGNKPKELTKQLYVRTTNLSATISNYNSYIKSSRLRSISVSLTTILNGTSAQLMNYLSSEDSKEDSLTPSTKTAESETELNDLLNLTLSNAKLNGVLDRIYENQITLQVSLLLSLTSQLLARTKDEQLIAILTPFYSNLASIHANLESYSDLK